MPARDRELTPDEPPPRHPYGAMVVTCGAALVLTIVAGLASEMLGADRGATARERDADDVVRAELLSIGWRPARSNALREVSAELLKNRHVELLHAESPLLLELPNGDVVGEAADDQALAAASVIISDELNLLPAGFLDTIGLWRVVLCQDLSEDGLPIPSLPNYRHTLLIDVNAAADYLRRLVQHEVFHFFDLADDGFVLHDRHWEALNDPGFRYGHGGRSMRRPSAAAVSDTPGFITGYAMASVEEDKAKVFAFLMTAPRAMRERATHDAVIDTKVRRIKQLIGDAAPDMHQGFWRNIEAQRRR